MLKMGIDSFAKSWSETAKIWNQATLANEMLKVVALPFYSNSRSLFMIWKE